MSSRPCPCRSPWRPGPPAADRRGDRLHEQADRGDVARCPGGQRDEGDHDPGGHGGGGEGEGGTQLLAAAQAGQQPDRRLGAGARGRLTVIGEAGQPGHRGQRDQCREAGDSDHQRVADVPGQPHPGRQGHHGGHAAHHAGQADRLAPPLRRHQRDHQRAGDHDEQAEAQAADQADRDDRGDLIGSQQQQRRRAQQCQPHSQHPRVAEPVHQAGRGELGRHAGQHQHARHQPGARAASAGRGGEQRRDRQHQVETGQRAQRAAEDQDQPAGDDPCPGRVMPGGGRCARQSAHGHDARVASGP